jgi:hypothetical protein
MLGAMVRLVAIAACVLAGCYTARPFPGASCAANNECPSGLVCIAEICDLPGGSAVDAAADAPDAVMADAEGPPGPHGWHAATQIPGVNTASNETDPSMTDDDLTIVFTSDRPGGTGALDLYIGTRTSTGDPFTVRELTELNSTAVDQSPEISSDGLTIFFSTARAGANALIYSATRADRGSPFGAPAEVPSLSKDMTGTVRNNIQIGMGGSLINAIVIEAKTGKNQPEGYDRPDISTTSWTDEVELAGIELTPDVSAPSLLPDASVEYFQSGVPPLIFTANYTESTNTFSTPVALTELNTGTRNAAPEISAGGSHLAFERDGDLYESTK